MANGVDAAEVWLRSHLPQVYHRTTPWLHGFDAKGFVMRCKADLNVRLPTINRRRNNLNKENVLQYLIGQVQIVEMLFDAVSYFKHIYSTFAKIANENFSLGREGGHEVTLHTLHEAFRCLPATLSEAAVLDISFHGLLNATLISPDHYIMTDIFDLAASLGQLSYGSWVPTRDQVGTYLYAVGRGPDQSPYGERVGIDRRRLADMLLHRFGLDKLEAELTAICNALAKGDTLPDELRGIRLQPMP